LLPTTAKIFLALLPQHRKLIGVVAFNADHFSTLLPTMWKSTLISVHVFFCIVAYNANNFSFHVVDHSVEKCCIHSGKIIGVVSNKAEKY
jgi:hypothetical protein